jgi:hypothetical protein
MKVIVVIVLIVIALAAGGAASWWYFTKRKKQGEEKAKVAIDNSVAADPERAKIKQEIDARIKENERIREELKKKLGQ